MLGAKRAALGLLGLAVLGAVLAAAPSGPARGASLDCTARWLNQTELTICDDQELIRMEGQLARRLEGYAQRLNFGQYLGLRHWHAVQVRKRRECLADRDCIVGSYRAQARFLDRLQRCTTMSLARRACLRDLIAEERETVRR